MTSTDILRRGRAGKAVRDLQQRLAAAGYVPTDDDALDKLVTFVPQNAHFRAHDLHLMTWQAKAIGLPHRRIIIEPPYDAGYERALAALRADGIECVVTGDIAEVGGHPNFVTARAETTTGPSPAGWSAYLSRLWTGASDSSLTV